MALNLNKLQIHILEVGDLRAQQREALIVLPQIAAERDGLKSEYAQLRAQFRGDYVLREGDHGQDPGDPVTIEREERIASVFRVATFAVVAFDAVFSANLARGWLRGREQVAFAIGAGLAVLLSYACKGVAAVRLESNQPLRSRRHLQVASLITAAVTAALVGVIFATRSPSEALIDYARDFAPVVLGLAALALPALAGCLWSLAENYGWSKPLAEKFRANAHRRAKLTGVEHWLQCHILGTAGQQPSPGTGISSAPVSPHGPQPLVNGPVVNQPPPNSTLTP